MWLTLLLAISVGPDGASLRAGCDASSAEVSRLEPGTPVKLLYSLAGEAVPCYKVNAEVAGKSVRGYLPASSMDGIDTFDRARRDAAWIEIHPIAPRQSRSSSFANEAPSKGLRIAGTKMAFAAQALIESGRPREALRLLEPELRKKPDAALLTMAGLAAWKDEDNRQALEYWKQSLELQPDPELHALYTRVEREVKNDVSRDKLYGMRVMLRYDNVTIPTETARRMAGAVDETYARVSYELGCRTDERIETIVQSWDAYRKTTAAAEWSGGMFDGRIHMPADSNQQMTPDLQKKLAHETTHACLAMIGKWPNWLHEGLAQKLSGETLPPAARTRLLAVARESKLTDISKLNSGWAQLDSRNASLAYALALAAVESMYEEFGPDGIRNLMRNPERLPFTVTEVNKRLGF
ncbi:MAG: hypothetical protein ABL995_17470 [Bryobacteraceae bacterium]